VKKHYDEDLIDLTLPMMGFSGRGREIYRFPSVPRTVSRDHMIIYVRIVILFFQIRLRVLRPLRHVDLILHQESK